MQRLYRGIVLAEIDNINWQSEKLIRERPEVLSGLSVDYAALSSFTRLKSHPFAGTGS